MQKNKKCQRRNNMKNIENFESFNEGRIFKRPDASKKEIIRIE